jgi:DNA polymerase III epsilon subunit-like protein
MKYVSIDIETTGLNPETCQILSVGLVVEDTNNIVHLDELPKLEIGIVRENITGELFALNMNKDLLWDLNHYNGCTSNIGRELVSDRTGREYLKEDQVAGSILTFLLANDVFADQEDRVAKIMCKNNPQLYFTAAGKNFESFDLKFLERLPRWKQYFKVRSRVLDPAILFVDWKNDKSLPSLSACKERAGFDSHVSHNAVEDALDVVALLRKSYAAV